MKRFLPLLAVTFAFAAPPVQKEKQMTMEEKVDLLWMRSENNTYGAQLSTGREGTPNNWIANLDLIYWHPKTDLTELGTAPAGSGTNPDAGLSTPYVDFNWSFGFKAGVGYHFDQREWDFIVEYTRVMMNGNKSLTPGGSRVVHSNAGESTTATTTSARASHKISYQTVTADLSRRFFVNPWLSLQPGWGAKAAWINQKPHLSQDVDSGSSIRQQIFLSEKTVGLGPRMSLCTNWYMKGGFSFYADTAAALLFTNYRGSMAVNGRLNEGSVDSTFVQSNNEKKHYITPNMMLGIGLSYEKRFLPQERNLRVSLGYESQFYFNQSFLMQNRRIAIDGVEQGAWLARNLAVYGLTLSAALEF